MATAKTGCSARLGRSLLCAAAASLPMLFAPPAAAAPPSASAQAEFERLHPCPARDAKPGSCPGYVIEHVVPVCLGGPDVAYNLRWQTLAEAQANDAREARRCPASRGEGRSVNWIAR